MLFAASFVGVVVSIVLSSLAESPMSSVDLVSSRMMALANLVPSHERR